MSDAHPWPTACPRLGRRSFLKVALGAAGALAAAPLLPACTAPTDPNRVTLGSRLSDQNAKAGLRAVVDDFEARTGMTVPINTVDSTSFQENVNNYLQGTPDDVFTWMSGYRMRYFAEKGLVDPIDEVWQTVGAGFNKGFQQGSTGNDGRKYLVPFYYYPWAVFYRPSLWRERGYRPPASHDEWVALCRQMQRDSLVPIGFGVRDGWPPFGTFDYLNLRINGADFHRQLLAGDISWTDRRVYTVFDTFRQLLPYHQPRPLGRKISEAQQALLNKEVGMMVVGMFVAQSFPEGPDRDDLDFFAFPEFDPAIGTAAVEAPMDGLMMRHRPRNHAGAVRLLEYVGQPDPSVVYASNDPQAIPAHRDADLTRFSPMVQKAAALVQNSPQITQFLDRDTRPDFASVVMIPAMQQFLGNPDDVDGLLRSIERQKKAVFGS
jgi:multiple sugar transport system substrate-binding protein